jgi:MFS family permease
MDKENEPSPNAVVDHYEDVDKMEPSTKPSKDIGAQFLAETTETEFTAKSEQKVIRRIDRVLLPVMFISFGLQYMDKALLNSAAQFGIVEDLGLYEIKLVDKIATLNLNKFSNVTLIFYWGYFVGGKSPSTSFGTSLDEHNIGIAFPAVYLAQRLPTGKFSSVAIMIWGVVTISTAGVKTYPGFMVQRFSRSLPSHVLLLKLDRFFLGVCEAAISPAFSLITAMWYKPTEQPLRFAVWYASTGLGGLVGSIATWGIGHIHGALQPWQYQFIILGAITVAWGLVVLYLLPDNPVQARFLSHMEKTIAVERMRRGQTGIENSHFKGYQMKEALLDLKTWLLVVMTLSIQMVNGAVSGFGSIIVSSFGFNGFQSVLLTGALGGIVFILLLGFGYEYNNNS